MTIMINFLLFLFMLKGVIRLHSAKYYAKAEHLLKLVERQIDSEANGVVTAKNISVKRMNISAPIRTRCVFFSTVVRYSLSKFS